MKFGFEDPSGAPWEDPIYPPDAEAWGNLVAYLDEEDPRDPPPRDLPRYKKQIIRTRDGHQCRLSSCSKYVDPSSPPDVIGQELNVHHIIPMNNGGQHNPRNLITLCEPCHVALHNEIDEAVPEHERFIGSGVGDQDFMW